MHAHLAALVAQVTDRALDDTSAPTLRTYWLSFVVLLAAGCWLAWSRSRRPVAAWLVVLFVSLVWLRVDTRQEIRVIWVLDARHGLTLADLLVPAVIGAAVAVRWLRGLSPRVTGAFGRTTRSATDESPASAGTVESMHADPDQASAPNSKTGPTPARYTQAAPTAGPSAARQPGTYNHSGPYTHPGRYTLPGSGLRQKPAQAALPVTDQRGGPARGAEAEAAADQRTSNLPPLTSASERPSFLASLLRSFGR